MRRSQSMLTTIVAATVTSILTTVILFFALPWLVSPRAPSAPAITGAAKADDAAATIDVPNILGVRTDQAREMLDPKGLILTLEDEREDPNAPAGTLVAQTPLAGSRAKRGSEVRAIVSRGLVTPRVPAVVGLRVDQATLRITQAKLVVGKQLEMASGTAPRGTVIETTPEGGAALPVGGVVEFVISLGATVEVPKVTGLGLAKATSALQLADVTVGSTRYEYNENFGGNIVLRQKPEAGTQVPAGTKIDLVLNEAD